MSSLGIYFGPKLISIVETKGRKLINSIQIPQSTISAGELDEKVPQDVKIIGIIALFKEELRRNKIEAKEATVCLSGRDLVVRTFEIPLLPREELNSAINFEVKKYIPFKVEELISDFQLKFDKASHSNLVLFMGIKKEALDRYLSILDQLDIKINAVEYAAFSVLRCLRLSGASNKGIIGILGADLEKKDEVNFTVLEDGFPLFSRDIILLNGPQAKELSEEAQAAQTLEKLKTEIRVSLDYYHRKFTAKDIKKLYLFAEQDYRLDLEAFLKELGLSVKVIDAARFTQKPLPYSLSFIKGYSSSLSKIIKTDITASLLAAKERARREREKEQVNDKELASIFSGFKLDYRLAALALLLCIATFGWGLYRIQPLHQELNRVVGMRTQVAAIDPAVNEQELTNIDNEYKRKLNALDDLIKKQLYVTEPLDSIPRVIPKGVWLTSFSLDRKEQGRAELILEGMGNLSDSDKEFEAVNRFLENLKENAKFSKYFKEIDIVSLDRRQLDQFTTVTVFLISCKTY